MTPTTYDLIVFGGGNAITVATECADAGWSVALIEKGPLGGTCPHRGCIPSKLLIAHAEVATTIGHADRFAMNASLEAVDPDRILSETKEFTARYDDLIGDGFPATLTHYRDHGRFLDDHALEVGGERITAPRIVLATGSRPRALDLPGDPPYWTSDDVFRQERAPESLTIVGGGFIACELGYFFDGVGVPTTLVVRDDVLLAPEDEEIRAAFTRRFPENVPTRFRTVVENVEHDGSHFRMDLVGSDGTRDTHTSEALLYAIGRVPNTDDIGLENTSLEIDERGFVRSDDRLRTNVDGVFSLGDVAGLYMFTHAANHEAEYLAKQLLAGTDEPIEYGPMPHAVFSHPQVAGVGRTQQQLEEDGTDFVGATISFEDTTRGRSLKQEGLAKMLLAPDGTILGCHIVGPEASVLLHEVLPVMRWRNHVSSITELIHIHPALGEVVRGVARKAAEQL